jgi:hypothetical protein
MSEQDGFAGHSDIVLPGDEEATARVLSQAVLGLWEVVNNLTRLRPTRRLRHRVTIFGSARTDPDHRVYATVRDLAAELTRLGCDYRNEDFVDAALGDYRTLVRLNLGRYPEPGDPVDPSPDGPLGPHDRRLPGV